MNDETAAGRNQGLWVVDRIESGIAVLVRDDDAPPEDVPLAVLPAAVTEGTVLRVREVHGKAAWSSAVVDIDVRRKRLQEAEELLAGLQKRDPGGDVVL